MEHAKRLPCGHIFHQYVSDRVLTCVRSISADDHHHHNRGCILQWIERSPSCPTCRHVLLDSHRPNNPPAAPTPVAGATPAPAAAIPTPPARSQFARTPVAATRFDDGARYDDVDLLPVTPEMVLLHCVLF